MPLYDFFKNLFNLPNSNNNLHERQSNEEPDERDFRNNFWNPNGQKNDEAFWRNIYENDSNGREDEIDDDMRNFNIFTDPLEMHRYFEQQMNEVLKSFGGFFGSDKNFFFGFNDNIPALARPESHLPSTEQPSQNESLRERLLKPEYNTKTRKSDQVLDDSIINAVDIDKLLKDKPAKAETDIARLQQQKPSLPQIRSFGQSTSSKTIRRADGSIEIHKTVRDSAGNEESVVTKIIDDKQYTIKVRTDKEGRQEKSEDLINIDENELLKFKDHWNRGNAAPDSLNDDVTKLFPLFDKFFK